MLLVLKKVFSVEVIKKIIIILLAILIATITTSFSLRKAYGDGDHEKKEEGILGKLAKEVVEEKKADEKEKEVNKLKERLKKLFSDEDEKKDKEKPCEHSAKLEEKLKEVLKIVSDKFDSLEKEIEELITAKEELMKTVSQLKAQAFSEMIKTQTQVYSNGELQAIRQKEAAKMVAIAREAEPLLENIEELKGDIDELKESDDKDKEKKIGHIRKVLAEKKQALAKFEKAMEAPKATLYAITQELQARQMGIARGTRMGPNGEMISGQNMPQMPGQIPGQMIPGQMPGQMIPGQMPGQPQMPMPQSGGMSQDQMMKNFISQWFFTQNYIKQWNRQNQANPLLGQPNQFNGQPFPVQPNFGPRGTRGISAGDGFMDNSLAGLINYQPNF